jgi:anti-anti-sigma regulatory factor
MLRISVAARGAGTIVTVEGRLAGAWVDELERSWSSIVATGRDALPVRVDLEAVTFIDADGKALLRRLHHDGAVLVASGCMTRAILEEIGAAGCSAAAPLTGSAARVSRPRRRP